MTLARLIEAVEAGTLKPTDLVVLGPAEHAHAWGAYKSGSLDDAKRLHDALLPGWGGAAGFDYYTGLCRSTARVSHMGKSYFAHIDDATQTPRPARAWILAILRAMEGLE